MASGQQHIFSEPIVSAGNEMTTTAQVEEALHTVRKNNPGYRVICFQFLPPSVAIPSPMHAGLGVVIGIIERDEAGCQYTGL